MPWSLFGSTRSAPRSAGSSCYGCRALKPSSFISASFCTEYGLTTTSKPRTPPPACSRIRPLGTCSACLPWPARAMPKQRGDANVLSSAQGTNPHQQRPTCSPRSICAYEAAPSRSLNTFSTSLSSSLWPGAPPLVGPGMSHTALPHSASTSVTLVPLMPSLPIN